MEPPVGLAPTSQIYHTCALLSELWWPVNLVQPGGLAPPIIPVCKTGGVAAGPRLHGVPGQICTDDLRLRRATLSSAELRAQLNLVNPPGVEPGMEQPARLELALVHLRLPAPGAGPIREQTSGAAGQSRTGVVQLP